MALNDDQKRYFFSQLAALSRGDKISLTRSAGQMMDDCAFKTQAAFLSCLPAEIFDSGKSPGEDTLQNLFFVAGMYCKTLETPNWNAKQDEDQQMGGRIRIEKEIAKILTGPTYAEATAERKMQDVLGARTGPHGTIYRILSTLLAKSNTRLDCWRLINDLKDWNSPSHDVQRRWTREYIATKNHTSENTHTKENVA